MELYILSQDLNILGVIGNYNAIIWNPKMCEPGIFQIEIPFSQKANSTISTGEIIYKTDEEDDNAAIITTKLIRLRRNGEQVIIISGYMASRYLTRRIIWSKTILTGTPEEAMRRLVTEQIISPADPDRAVDMIALGELSGISGAIERQVTYDNLQDTLTSIAQAYKIGYRLHLDLSTKKYLFEVYEGVDRTAGTEHPCIFSRDFENVFTQDYSEDDSNHMNVALVGGPGEDENRLLAVSGEGAGIDRREVFINSSGVSAKDLTTAEIIAQLQQVGYEKLAERAFVSSFESNINMAAAMPFKLGDKVTCTDTSWNIRLDTYVTEIEMTYSVKSQECLVTFGEGMPSLIKLIKNEVKV